MCESGSTKVRAPLNKSIYSLSTAKIIFIMLLLLHEKKTISNTLRHRKMMIQFLILYLILKASNQLSLTATRSHQAKYDRKKRR